MKNIVSSYISRKWWFRYIRTSSWFSFRYYWVNWLVFLSSVIVLCWLINKPIIQEGCNIDVIENSIVNINERLTHCCNCINQQNTPNTPPLPQNTPPLPPNTIQCDGNNGITDNGNNLTPDPKFFEVGNHSGTMQLCYDNGNTYPDNIIVKHKGVVIKETGVVIGKACIDIPYLYNPGDPTFVEVIVRPSTSDSTKWEYRLGCPN